VPSEAEVAWAAGLFDGEGTIFAGKINRYRRQSVRLYMAVAMTDHEPVERFHDVVGVGRIVWLPSPDPSRKPKHRWEVSSNGAVLVAWDVIAPACSPPKCRQAAAAFAARAAYESLPKLVPAQCQPHAVCRRGHDLSVTRYRAPGGGTYCRECAAARRRGDAPLLNGGGT
jgi:hypothetical protein